MRGGAPNDKNPTLDRKRVRQLQARRIADPHIRRRTAKLKGAADLARTVSHAVQQRTIVCADRVIWRTISPPPTDQAAWHRHTISRISTKRIKDTPCEKEPE